MHHVIVHKLRTDHQIAYELGVDGNLVLQRVFDRTHGSNAVHERTNTADTLRKCPGIAGVAVAEDDLDTAHHRPGARRAGDHSLVVGLGLDPQMPFNARHRVDDDRLPTHDRPPSSCAATSSSRLAGVLSQLKC